MSLSLLPGFSLYRSISLSLPSSLFHLFLSSLLKSRNLSHSFAEGWIYPKPVRASQTRLGFCWLLSLRWLAARLGGEEGVEHPPWYRRLQSEIDKQNPISRFRMSLILGLIRLTRRPEHTRVPLISLRVSHRVFSHTETGDPQLESSGAVPEGHAA